MGISFLANEGFGFNGNILETNIVNLAVVISVVVSFGGDALRSLLKTRKETILKNFSEAKSRSDEARQRLFVAKQEVDAANQKAKTIRDQIVGLFEQERQNYADQFIFEIKRLEVSKQETLAFEEKQAQSRLAIELITLALTKVEEIFFNWLSPKFHTAFNDASLKELEALSVISSR